MASYLRPRRGKKATAVSQLTGASCLKRGEVFFEVPDAGVGAGKGAIKMGDGSTDYANLPYFLQPFDPDSASIGFTDASAAEADPYTTNATHAAAITPTANLKTIFTNLKQLLLNYNSQLTSLNNDLDNISDKFYFGAYIPELISGGNSLKISTGDIQYFVVGNLCFLSCAIWADINNPNSDEIKLSLPSGIKPISRRSYGWVGYHQSKSIETMYVLTTQVDNCIGFEKPIATGSLGVKGVDMNNMTIQFSIVFAI